MATTVYIDDPHDLEISKSIVTIKGWCSADAREELRGLRFQIGRSQVLCTPMERPDVTEALPDKFVAGFLLHLDLSYYMWAVRNCEVTLRVITATETPTEIRFQISASAIGTCLATATGL